VVTLRCTRRLLVHLEIHPVDEPLPATGRLGDWYANLIFTDAGDLIIFVNERSLLTVAVPVWETKNLVEMFRLRVANLLSMIGVPTRAISEEIGHLAPLQFARTASRSLLGSMNDIAWQYQVMAEGGSAEGGLSLSDAENGLSEMPCGPLDYRFPRDVARELLGIPARSAS